MFLEWFEMKKGIFISLAVVVVIFLAMLGIYIDKRIPITKGFFYLCENVNNSIECRDTDVNFSSLIINDFDLNFTKLTNDIAGGFEFVNEDDSNEFIKLYNKSILN